MLFWTWCQDPRQSKHPFAGVLGPFSLAEACSSASNSFSACLCLGRRTDALQVPVRCRRSLASNTSNYILNVQYGPCKLVLCRPAAWGIRKGEQKRATHRFEQPKLSMALLHFRTEPANWSQKHSQKIDPRHVGRRGRATQSLSTRARQ